jgi:hypothetical protein
MEVFKTIFRLDFPLAYRILDKLGEYLELIHVKTAQAPFSNGKGNVNLVEHSLSYSAKVGDDTFSLNLDTKTFNAVIEYQDGSAVNTLAKHPLFSLADEVIEKLAAEHSSKYKRIGVRSLILLQKDEFDFAKVRDYMWETNNVFGKSVTDLFNKRYDIGVTFEAQSDDEEYIRVNLGPYHEREIAKYFSLKNDVKKGFIFDIDIWQGNVSIPQLKLIELVHRYQNIYSELVRKIESQLPGVLA